MTTYRKIHDHWTEAKRVLVRDGEPIVKQTTCTCDVPAGDAMGCAKVRRCKTRCRCFCHSNKTEQEWRDARTKP